MLGHVDKLLGRWCRKVIIKGEPFLNDDDDDDDAFLLGVFAVGTIMQKSGCLGCAVSVRRCS